MVRERRPPSYRPISSSVGERLPMAVKHQRVRGVYNQGLQVDDRGYLQTFGQPDPGKDADLSGLMASLERRRPVITSLVPRWNLPWVLTWLSSEKFEPLSSTPTKELTLKTCFLLALATAARVSELHALSTKDECLQWRQDGSVHLVTDPSFIAKNRLPSVGAQSIHLRPIRQVDDSSLARLQCPVRALKYYLRRTKETRGDRSRLFLPLVAGRRDLTAQTISHWISVLIKGGL